MNIFLCPPFVSHTSLAAAAEGTKSIVLHTHIYANAHEFSPHLPRFCSNLYKFEVQFNQKTLHPMNRVKRAFTQSSRARLARQELSIQQCECIKKSMWRNVLHTHTDTSTANREVWCLMAFIRYNIWCAERDTRPTTGELCGVHAKISHTVLDGLCVGRIKPLLES